MASWCTINFNHPEHGRLAVLIPESLIEQAIENLDAADGYENIVAAMLDTTSGHVLLGTPETVRQNRIVNDERNH